jgi:ABC-type nickel/cobalt efflux system permease component RcnA
VRRLLAGVSAVLATLALPAAALAHPLGNFTINHYAGIRVSPTEIRLDVVLDQAEIPTFQERLRLDLDADGEVSDHEIDAAREPECRAHAASLELRVDGVPVDATLVAAGLSFNSGAGGLSTMRLVCELVAPLAGGLDGGRSVAFADRSFAERLGWREIVVQGDAAVVAGKELLAETMSDRLTAYPPDRLGAPPAMTTVEFVASPGGAPRPAFNSPDAAPIAGAPSAARPATSPVPDAPDAATVPGGVAAEVPAIFRTADLSPGVLLLALATALALGAAHALTPGHGKTLMAAYLVGTRGTALHAAGLGLSMTVSHTLGILVLAALVVAAGAALPPDVVVRWLPLIAAATIVAIGAWMIVTEIRRRRRAGRAGSAAGHEHPDSHAHPHPHGHAHPHPHAQEHSRAQEHSHAQEHAHPQEHSHGGIRHSHAPPPGTTITWRSLFALGLAGGIVPSTSALVILLGTIAAGRPAFGVVLVVAFGLGMALVMGGIGLALVLARERLERLSVGSRFAHIAAWTPLAAAGVVLALGLWLTGQALLAGPTL